MKKGNNPTSKTRQENGDIFLKKNPSLTGTQITEADSLKLIHELEVHKIELEIQNEELILARSLNQNTTDKYAYLYDYAPFGYFTLSREGSILDLNIAGSQLFGLGRLNLKQRRFGLFVSDATKPVFNRFLEDVFTGKAKETCEVILLTNGPMPVNVRLIGIATDNGHNCLLTAIDIDRSKQAEESLQMSEEHYRTLFTRMGEGFALCEMLYDDNGAPCDYRILEVNNGYEKQTGLKASDVQGKRILELFPTIEKAWIQNFGQVVLTGKPFRFEDYNHNTGKYYDAYAYSPSKGKFATLIVDITERKHTEEALRNSEERFRSILNNSRDVIYRLNIKTGRYEYVSPSSTNVVGFSPEEQQSMDLEQAMTLIHPDSLPMLKAAQTFTVENGKGEVEYRQQCKNGDWRWISNHMSLIRDNEGKPLYRDGIFRDITELKLIEDVQLFLLNSDRSNFGEGFFSSLAKYLAKLLDMDYVCIDRLEGDGLTAQTVAVFNDGKFDPNISYQLKDTPCGDVVGQSICCFEQGVARLFPNDIALQDLKAESYIGTTLWSFDGKPIGLIALIGRKPLMNPKMAQTVLKLVAIRAAGELERTQREAELLESKQRLEMAQRSAGVGIWDWNMDNHHLTWSPELYNLFGLDPSQSEATFKTWGNLIHPEDRSIAENRIGQAVENREPLSNEYRIIKNDEIHWILSVGNTMYSESGLPKRMAGICMDITKRKLAEEALVHLKEELEERVKDRTAELSIVNAAIRRAEEKYRTVSDFTHDWEFWLDPNRKMIYCSPSCDNITGYCTALFLQNSELLYKIVHPDDQKKVLCHRLKEDRAEGENHEIQYRIIRADGSIRWIGHVCQPVYNSLGRYAGIRGSNRDITDRKKIEDQFKAINRRYRLVSENISDGIFICRNEQFEYVNKAMTRIFGYSNHELETMNLTQLVTSDYQSLVKGFLTMKSSVNQARNAEVECTKKDQSNIFTEILFNYVAKEGVVFGVVHDITEKRLIQKNILKAIIQTEENERAHFSKELHDGLGPMLSLVKLYMQWTQRSKGEITLEEIIAKAENAIDEALTTVKEISNKLSPNILAYHGLTKALENFISRLRETSVLCIDFKSNLSRRLDIEIEASLYRAAIECINNTIRHAGAKNIYIQLNDLGGELTFQYKDDGNGFDLVKILSQNKGFGLTNLQNRIQNIGGKINLFSKPGQGVEYQICINL